MAVEVDPHAALQRFCERFELQKDAAEELGIKQPYLSDLLKHQRPFSDNILEKLGLKRIVVKA